MKAKDPSQGFFVISNSLRKDVPSLILNNFHTVKTLKVHLAWTTNQVTTITYLFYLMSLPSFIKRKWSHSLMTFSMILKILEVSIISLVTCLFSTTEKSYSLYLFLWLLFHTFSCGCCPFLLSSPVLPHCFKMGGTWITLTGQLTKTPGLYLVA